MASVLNEDSVEKKLRTVTNTQDSIQTLSLWIIHHKASHAKIVELWMKVLKKSASPAHRLTLFYLCNDVVQNCKKKKAFVYNTTFKECLREAASLVRDPSVKGKVERIFNIWGERGVYDTTFVKSLHSVLNGQQVKSYNVRENVKEEASIRPVSQPHSHSDVSQQAEVEPKDAAVEQQAGPDAEECARILAEFKPRDMIDQVTAFVRQEVEIKSKATKLSHLKLDSTSLEAMKQLKDRSVGNNFSSQCDEACVILDDLIKRQTSHIRDLRVLLETLSLSETFYEEQYREAKIVANAYRNFGARINNMKKKLDELKQSLPEVDSPIPSPDINAPSPDNTPPFVGISDYSNSPPSLVNYSNSPPAPIKYGHGLQQKSWLYTDTKSTGGAGVVSSLTEDMDSIPGSPSLEAPSPDGSPPDLNLDAADNGTGSLDSRLASFFDREPLDTSSNPPVYTPQRPLSVLTTSRPSVGGDEDRSTTPLDDDEAPTTPVQDEHLASPPKRSSPPKKENPIDFLSRLITQTQKVPPVKSGTQSFLDSLTMLTMVSKKPETDAQKQQASAASSPWTPWTSNSTDKKTSPSQPSSPSSYIPASSLPSSPETFHPVLPMVPPPIPIPVPPPPSLGMALNMPPPPPPFVLTQALTPNFTSPPPNFQQTSPGQKENWPDIQHSQTTDHANSIRATHSSVLKELVPADGITSNHGLHVDHSAMDIGNNDESNDTLRAHAETPVDAKVEFGQKLKQKTSYGALKSHAFVPNPERPNLMTLTVSDDLDEADMIDDDTVVEETPTWSDKPGVSGTRSRSESREKDTSFQHPQMDNWDHSGADDSGLAASDSKPISSISSTLNKVEPYPRSNRNGNDEEKFDERSGKNNNYWRQIDRKYDQFYKRGYRGRGNFRPFRGNRGFKDGVQAYTQAYKEAFQQYNQPPVIPFFPGPPPMDPSRPGYGQY